MKINKTSLVVMAVLITTISGNAVADKFWRNGQIQRVISDSEFFGGCMVLISNPIANGCPDNGWVSLDCKNVYFDNGKNKYATVLTAYSLNKPISVYMDNTKKHNSYCVALRVDF